MEQRGKSTGHAVEVGLSLPLKRDSSSNHETERTKKWARCGRMLAVCNHSQEAAFIP